MTMIQSGDGDGGARHLLGKPAMQREKGTGGRNGNEELRAISEGMLLLKIRPVSLAKASCSGSQATSHQNP